MTIVFFAIAALVVLAVVAIAAERAYVLDAGETAHPGHRLPAGELGQADVDAVRFDSAFLGYDARQVDAVLKRLRAELRRGGTSA